MAQKSYKETFTHISFYKGYGILKETTTYFQYDPYFKEYNPYMIQSVSNWYRVYIPQKGMKSAKSLSFDSFTSLEKAMEHIDWLTSGKKDVFYATQADNNKMHRENAKNGYGLCFEQLMDLMHKHKRATAKGKFLIEERLTDINFHSYCAMLIDRDYQEFEETAREEWKDYLNGLN